jgi:SAM-dependent methyltransferase
MRASQTSFESESFLPFIREDNKLRDYDQAAHDWYRFVLAFPPHLVRTYLERFGISSGGRVLDPFCGTGTTLVECKKLGIESAGIEANPLACFATGVKLNWDVDPDALLAHTIDVAQCASVEIKNSDLPLRTLPEESLDLLLENSISPIPLHKTLVLLETLSRHRDERFEAHERLAVARCLVSGISNLNFGPEVGVGAIKQDAPVIEVWLDAMKSMAEDLRELAPLAAVPATVICGDARYPLNLLPPGSVDAVITSPPYPNEKDYTRTTRLESVLLGFLRSKQDLRGLKQHLVRSNTRNVYKDDQDDLLIAENTEIQAIAEAIESRRVELGKTSGFERLYAKVTKLYFGGMARHLSQLRGVLRRGARLAFVVGDQASYLRVMIRTGKLLADIAGSLGYEVAGIDLFRTRLATATKEQLREEAVLLRWPGWRTQIAMGRNMADSAYSRIIGSIFQERYAKGVKEVEFDWEDISSHAEKLGISVPKNLGDVVYSFRYRKDLPETISKQTPEGEAWIIRGTGRGKYKFALVPLSPIAPNQQLALTKVPDATPQIIVRYALNDEQALLAIIRHSRLIDIFTRTTCYSLQNHLRTTVAGMGQIETDEVYVGVDHRGAQYVFPVQAKGHKDKLGIVQIEQDIAMCEEKFPNLICRPIAAQFMAEDVIALFAFEQPRGDLPKIDDEKHYKLVPSEDLSDDELASYGLR